MTTGIALFLLLVFVVAIGLAIYGQTHLDRRRERRGSHDNTSSYKWRSGDSLTSEQRRAAVLDATAEAADVIDKVSRR